MENIPCLIILTVCSRGRLSFPSLSKNLQWSKLVFPVELSFQIIVSSAGSCLLQFMNGLFPFSFILKEVSPVCRLLMNDSFPISPARVVSSRAFTARPQWGCQIRVWCLHLLQVWRFLLALRASVKMFISFPSGAKCYFSPFCRVSSPWDRRDCFDWCTSDWWFFPMEFYIIPW